MNGQISIFDILSQKQINRKNECLGEPCMYCNVEWCSLSCFLKRGYMWNKIHGFIRNEKGEVLRTSIENRECKKDY